MQEYNFLYIFDIKIIEIIISTREQKYKKQTDGQTDRHTRTYTHRHTDMKQLNPQYLLQADNEYRSSMKPFFL